MITRDGTVADVRVLRSADPMLDDASVVAVKQWRYRPAIFNGEPVCVYLTVTTSFSLAVRTPAE